MPDAVVLIECVTHRQPCRSGRIWETRGSLSGEAANGIPSRRDSPMKERQARLIRILERLRGVARLLLPRRAILFYSGGRRRALQTRNLLSSARTRREYSVLYYVSPMLGNRRAMESVSIYERFYSLSRSLSLSLSLVRSLAPYVYATEISAKSVPLCAASGRNSQDGECEANSVECAFT